MKKLLVCLLAMMSTVVSAKTLTTAFSALENTPNIDGLIQPGEWVEANAVHLSRAFHNANAIKLYFAHDQKYLYLAADVADSQLWADGNGGGSGNVWENSHDDSIEWYFDINNSKETHLQSDDRFLALNIGNITDPVNGSGVVSRRSFNAGTGNGGASGIINPTELPGIHYNIRHQGTVNNSNDIDTGYSIEVAISWDLLPGSNHGDGDSMGINAIIISDDTGGTRDFSDNREIEPPSARFTVPARPDEYVELRHSVDHGSQSGLSGPAHYQTLQFHNKNDVIAPSPVTEFTASNTRAYSTRLHWKNPGDNGGQGYASSFDVRYSTTPISDSNFYSAKAWPYKIAPDKAGEWSEVKVLGLQPETEYYFAVRAYDEVKNLGQIASLGPIKTYAISTMGSSISQSLYKGSIQVAPSGRYFMKENGDTFIPTGTHFLQQDAAIRHFYSGSIWTGTICHDFSSEKSAKTKAEQYINQLKQNGVTVMRLFLEDHSLNVPNNGLFNEENCAYWLEFPRGNFNTKMASFMKEVLRLCAENNIYVLLSPFDTFYYDNYFERTVWHKNNGGPLDNINDFFKSYEAFEMSKARWSWVIQQVKASGYEDAVLGYEIMNEWDSFEWTKPDQDANQDAIFRTTFIKALAEHVRSLDDEHLLLNSTTALDPRGALGSFMYYEDLFDAVLPHLYQSANREPWNNPHPFFETQVFIQQSQILSWWSSNQFHPKPILNGEWGPSDGWLPNPSAPSYFSGFTEQDDEQLTRRVWFTELASGAAGPGVRMQGGVRGNSQHGLHLSDTMLATAKTLASFTTSGSDYGTLDFTDFAGQVFSSDIALTNTNAKILKTGTTDGKQGMVYLMQDQNSSSGKIAGAKIKLGAQLGGSHVVAEFWNTTPNQTVPTRTVEANPSSLNDPNDISLNVPEFADDWMIKFYEMYSLRINKYRLNNQEVFMLEASHTEQMNPLDIYVVVVMGDQVLSLTRNELGQVIFKSGISPYLKNTIPNEGTSEIISLPVSSLQNLKADLYVGSLLSGKAVETFDFKTLQKLSLNY